MCTSIVLNAGAVYAGRTLDLDVPFGERVAIAPREFPFTFRRLPVLERHQAVIGMAAVEEGRPLFAEAVNEAGVYIAGLNFPHSARYPGAAEGEALAPYELIPWLLGVCGTAAEAAERLRRMPLTGEALRPGLPAAPLHWHIADREGAFVAEPTEEGLRIWADPVGVLTNEPPFPFHLANLSQYLGCSPSQPDNRLDPAVGLRPFGQGMGAVGLPGDLSPASRYVRAAFCLRNSACPPEEGAAVAQFFRLLDGVSMPRGAVRTPEGRWDVTRYACCVNTDTGTYYYRTYDSLGVAAVTFGEERRAGRELLEFPLEELSAQTR